MAFKWDVNLGHMLIAVPLIIGGTIYIVTDHNAVATLTINYNDIKNDMQKGFEGIRGEIRALPIVQANMDQFKARLDDAALTAKDLRTAVNADHEAALKLSGRVDSLSDTQTGLRRDLDALARGTTFRRPQ